MSSSSLVPKQTSEISSSSSSSAVAIYSSGGGKPPKPKPKILDEDDYLEKLESIIQRDFYPDIAKLKAQTEYLEAVERNDVEKIRSLQLRYSCRRTDLRPKSPGTPAYFETPVRASVENNQENPAAQEEEEIEKPKNVDDEPSTSEFSKKPDEEAAAADETETESRIGGKASSAAELGVDEFLAKYTSEDNASFEEIMERSEAKHRHKFAWMYNAEEEHRRRMQASLTLPGADEQLQMITDGTSSTAGKPASLQNWTYQSKNALMFVPDGAEWSLEETERRHKIYSDRVISHENTRFAQNPFDDETARRSMSKATVLQLSAEKGKVDAQGDALAALLPGQPFGFVATPSPAPGVNESPLMTWGEIEGSPFRLDAGDLPVQTTPGPAFKMPEVPLRDKLAHDLTDEISRRNRDKKQAAIKQVYSLTPKSGSAKSVERLASLSPAGLRLATTKLGIRIGTDKALKASYTPSPLRSNIGDKTPSSSSICSSSSSSSNRVVAQQSGSTRQQQQQVSEESSISARSKRSTALDDESLTDNLLNLKSKKPRAADFF